jgi:isoamylase
MPSSGPPDLPPPLGVTPRGDGSADIAVYAGHADAVELCLFETGDSSGESERRVELAGHAHGTWFARVPDLLPGQRYGLRVQGPWEPARGIRHNPAKLLLDPYAPAVEGQVTWSPEVFGHTVGADLRGDIAVRDDRDSAAYVPRGVLLDNGFDWGADTRPQVRWADTVVYEAHVRGLTARHPGVPEELRGTYAGLAHPPVLEHLVDLGVTTVELLPVHAFVSEPALAVRGSANFWGYNTLSFMAPHAGYAASTDPQAAVTEFKGMVRLLHEAGLEVILDVVYNHTCEQGADGATLSLRGLDNRAYYRLDWQGRDVDVTGCGNTVDLRHPVPLRLVLDSLRHWVEDFHVDGFRFDLATALARGRDDAYDPDHPFLMALRTDPVLSRVKLIAEPWDVGQHGWRTGQFPPPFAEWNDRYRDCVKTFWLADAARQASGQNGHGVRELATRLAGSQDLFGTRDRGPLASVNYIAAHDGFTLADTTAYDRKHNEGNGEHNRDGHDDNRSWNHGVEGRTEDRGIEAARHLSIRNLLGTLLLSTGIPMLCAGDEMGRTQDGNNNAYCQDNDVSWIDWDLAPWQEELLVTTRRLLTLRREHPVLRQRQFFDGHPRRSDGTTDLSWYAADGRRMDPGHWNDTGVRTMQMSLDESDLGGGLLLVIVHGGLEADVTLPGEPLTLDYQLLWDSAVTSSSAEAAPIPHHRNETHPAGSTVDFAVPSVRLYAAGPSSS